MGREGNLSGHWCVPRDYNKKIFFYCTCGQFQKKVLEKIMRGVIYGTNSSHLLIIRYCFRYFTFASMFLKFFIIIFLFLYGFKLFSVIHKETELKRFLYLLSSRNFSKKESFVFTLI